MKVLMLTSSFPRDKEDIQVPWMVKLIQKLKENNVEVDVFAPSYKGIENHVLKYDDFQVMVYRFRYLPAKFEDLTHGSGAAQKATNYFKILCYMFFGWINLQWHLFLK